MTNVFVYGSLKRGFGNHPVIQDGSFIDEAITSEPSYEMFCMGGFPGVVHGDKLISGEVYAVDDLVLERLDRLEGNGSFYTREVVDTTIGPAWVYLLTDDYSHRRDDKTFVELIDNIQTWVRATY